MAGESQKVTVFFSYHFDDEGFVARVFSHLRKNPRLDVYYWAECKRTGPWPDQLNSALDRNRFVFFIGEHLGGTQQQEALEFLEVHGNHGIVRVDLPNAAPLPHTLKSFRDCDPIRVREITRDGSEAEECAKQIVRVVGIPWISDDDLPIGYPFNDEKAIIDAFVEGKGKLARSWVERGCCETWPEVEPPVGASIRNALDPETIGAFRPADARVIVDARSRGEPRQEERLTFLEAGPREKLKYPTRGKLTVGMLVSGGIAPGINAVIDGIFERHGLYHGRDDHPLTILGYRDGFNGVLRDGQDRCRVLYDQPGRRRSENEIATVRNELKSRASEGGSLLTTSRADTLLNAQPAEREAALRRIVSQLVDHDGVQILYVIGGDGSMRAAHAIWSYARKENKDLSVVGIPKTMDNDILWIWQSFGFLSAVERAKRVIQNLHTETTSNPRLCIIQLFGTDSGFVVSHAALGTGLCDLALIPEMRFTMTAVCKHIEQKLHERKSPHGLVLMAETAIPLDVEKYLDDPEIGLSDGRDGEKSAIRQFIENDRRVRGQTPDALRTGGLKVVSGVLQKHIRDEMGKNNAFWRDFRVSTNEPRHVIRANPPSVSDVISAHRLGTLAVDNAMAGYTDFMISQWLTEYVLVPLKLVVLGRKRLRQEGIFWNSVVANTGQPDPSCEKSA